MSVMLRILRFCVLPKKKNHCKHLVYSDFPNFAFLIRKSCADKIKNRTREWRWMLSNVYLKEFSIYKY